MGTSDVMVNIAICGSSGQSQITQADVSGQLACRLSQAVYLNERCGESSIHLAVFSGSASSSATVLIPNC